MLHKFKESTLIRFTSSLKLTVICLVILVFLIIWGTIYQTDYGLFAAQQKFFFSWFFLLFGFIPFPGTVLIFWILFINLICVLFFRIGFSSTKFGNTLTHIGIIILFIGGFLSSFTSKESVLSLKEGGVSNLSIAYQKWELAVWKGTQKKRIVYAVDSDKFKAKDIIKFEMLNLEIKIKDYFTNCNAFVMKNKTEKNAIINYSGIEVLKVKKNEIKPPQNVAGVIFVINNGNSFKKEILLFGNNPRPTQVRINKNNLFFSIRKKRYSLPFTIKLIDFKRTLYPGSEIVRSYESRVEIETKGIKREVLISMNKPLRYRNISMYQSSFYITKDGTEYTILAVVKNSVRIFPYISSLTIFLGMLIHFLVMLFKKIKKPKNHLMRNNEK